MTVSSSITFHCDDAALEAELVSAVKMSLKSTINALGQIKGVTVDSIIINGIDVRLLQ